MKIFKDRFNVPLGTKLSVETPIGEPGKCLLGTKYQKDGNVDLINPYSKV